MRVVRSVRKRGVYMSWPRKNPGRFSGQQTSSPAGEETGRVVELDPAARAPAPAPVPVRPSAPPAPNGHADADWTRTIDLVGRFADQLKASETRVAELEQAYRDLAERAERELALMAQRLEHAELCAKDAGERRREAEDWLRRIHDAIHKRFGAEMMVSIAREATRR